MSELTLTVCKRSGRIPEECGLAACDNGCDTEDLDFVRVGELRGNGPIATRNRRIRELETELGEALNLADDVAKLREDLDALIDRVQDDSVTIDDVRDEIADYLVRGEYAKLDDLNDYIRDAFDNARRAV